MRAKSSVDNYTPHYPNVYKTVFGLYSWGTRKRTFAFIRHDNIAQLDGFIDGIRSLVDDGALDSETARKVGEDLLNVKIAIDTRITPEKRTRAQNESSWRLWKLVQHVGLA